MTPTLVRLAREHEDRPLHILLFHHQRVPREQILEQWHEAGFHREMDQVTLSSFGTHPDVAVGGHLPKTFLFDHTGSLMTKVIGQTGSKLRKSVAVLLKQAPKVYPGPGPFRQHGKLARALAKGGRSGEFLGKVEAALASAEADVRDRTELNQLKASLLRLRDQRLEALWRRRAWDPAQTLKLLGDLVQEFEGSSVGADLAARAKELSSSEVFAAEVRLAAAWKSTSSRLESLGPCPSCAIDGKDTYRSACDGCRSYHRSALKKQQQALEPLIAECPDAPIVQTLPSWVRVSRR